MLDNDRWGVPGDWGLDPRRFKQWRPAQMTALDFYFDHSDVRHVILSMPTGSGKTPLYMALANRVAEDEGSAVVTTVTKQLQTQLLNEHPNLVDIRGRQNYKCIGFSNCRVGRDAACPHRGSPNCPYVNAYLTALSNRVVTTNTAYWAVSGNLPEQLHYKRRNVIGPDDAAVPRDLLVLDEAHDLVDLLTRELTCTFKDDEGPEYPHRKQVERWADWAAAELVEVQARLEEGPESLGAALYSALQARAETLARCVQATSETFALDDYEGTISITPIWPADFAEDLLFRGTERTILPSGTISPGDVELLGIPKSDSAFLQVETDFSPDRWRVYYMPVCRVDMRMSDYRRRAWLNRQAQLVESRPCSKGIILSVSYGRAREIAAALPRDRVLLHRREESTEEIVEKFRQSTRPLVLISPSVNAGVDFPYEQCAFVIIPKMPRQDTRSIRNMVKARRARFPNYDNHQMMKTWRQMIGRGMRSHDDFCEVFILDEHFDYNFRQALGTTIPESTRRFVRRQRLIPKDPRPFGN